MVEITFAQTGSKDNQPVHVTAPSTIINPEKSLERQELVLNAMLAQELISQEVYEQALSEDVIGNLADSMENRKDTVYSWFEDALLQEIVKEKLGGIMGMFSK